MTIHFIHFNIVIRREICPYYIYIRSFVFTLHSNATILEDAISNSYTLNIYDFFIMIATPALPYNSLLFCGSHLLIVIAVYTVQVF